MSLEEKYYPPNKEQMDILNENLVQIAKNIAASGTDAAYLAMLNQENYKQVMRIWFMQNGAAALTDFTALCEKWFTITRTGWTGGTKFGNPASVSTHLGTKLGNNAGMSVTPSTDSVAGVDQYQDKTLFANCDCNFTVDANGEPHITAIAGVCGSFKKGTVGVHVGVLQMTPWIKTIENADGTYEKWITDEPNKNGYVPFPDAVSLVDNHARAFVVHAKYPMGDDYDSISGVPVRVWDVSHNSQLTAIRTAWGNQYCGKTSSDDAWIKWMMYIKYGSLTLSGIMEGCTGYYNDLAPQVAETGVERVLLSVTDGAKLVVGSTVCLGSAGYGGKSTQCSVVDRKRIERIETVTVGGTDYAAVYIDNGGVAFDVTTELHLTTMQWWAGSTDSVLGCDGSPHNNTDGKAPFKIQGIECMNGCYEVMADTILEYYSDGGVNYMRGAVCRKANKLSTSITADYKRASYEAPCPASNSWTYPKKLGRDATLEELMIAFLLGGSTSTYTKDGWYILNASSGVYEWLAFGSLDAGGGAGVSCGDGYRGLSSSNWGVGGRLSATGNRGEWAA